MLLWIRVRVWSKMLSHSRVPPNLVDIPIRYFERRCEADTNLWGVKAGIRVTFDGENRPIVGFACGKELELARKKARSELLERLLTVWIKTSWAEDSFRESVNPDTAAAIEDLIGRDSTGLAFHPNLSQAEAHAKSELMERHILGRIWYDDLRIRLLDSRHTRSARGVEAALYTTTQQVELGHFAMSSIYDDRNEVFVVGSAIRETAHEAAVHAWEEAVVMHDSQLNDNYPPYVHRPSRERHKSLRGALSKIRYQHLQSRITSTGEDRTSTIGTPSAIVGDELFRTSVGYLVRSWVPNGTFALVSDYRVVASGVVPDPFC
jgi:ribosomal protein S12 methylthiotransferase accessory factor YcaO